MINYEKNCDSSIKTYNNMLRVLYEKYEYGDVIKIPKVIHQIWLGSEFPDKYKPLRDEMMNINSDWEYKLWTDEDVESFGLKNFGLYNNIKNLGSKSDILRYEVLERMGGLYIDTDFKCIKSFSDLCNLDFFAGHGADQVILNSLMASVPNHKYITEIVKRLTNISNFDDNIDGVMNTTGPYFIDKVFHETVYEEDNVVIFPTKFFFPFPNIYRHLVRVENEKTDKFVKSFNNENTYAIHLWHTTWQ